MTNRTLHVQFAYIYIHTYIVFAVNFISSISNIDFFILDTVYDTLNKVLKKVLYFKHGSTMPSTVLVSTSFLVVVENK